MEMELQLVLMLWVAGSAVLLRWDGLKLSRRRHCGAGLESQISLQVEGTP